MPIDPGGTVWMDGELVPWTAATVHVTTHSLHYGSAAFEGIRSYEARDGVVIFRLHEHVTRLFHSLTLLRMEIPHSKQEVVEAIKDTVRANGLNAWYIRPIVYRGEGEMGMDVRNSPIRMAIAVWRPRIYLGPEAMSRGVTTMVSSWRRPDHNVVPPAAKAAAHYMNSILARMEALSQGRDEAILLNTAGFVAEGTGENLFIVRDGVLLTPPLSAGILPGITRGAVIQMARDLGYTVLEVDVVRSDLYTANEAFYCGTSAEITPISRIDHVDLAMGPITSALQEAFYSTVRGDNPQYRNWLEYVDDSTPSTAGSGVRARA